MTERPRVLLVALDAAELSVVRRGVAAGWLPTLAGLAREGTTLEIHADRMFPGATWITITTGRRPHEHLQILDRQLEPGTYREPVLPRETIRVPPFWRHASDAGRTSIISNVYSMPLLTGFRGIQIQGWSGAPDPATVNLGGPRSDPPGLIAELEREVGRVENVLRPPLRRAADWRRFLRDADRTAARFSKAMRGLLTREGWDLAFISIAELHHIGHYAWHLGDPSHEDHDPDMPPDVRDLFAAAHRSVDAALARVLDVRRDEDLVLVLTPHGIGPNHVRGDPAGEILARKGLFVTRRGSGTAPGDRRRWMLRSAWNAARRVTPRRLRELVGSRIPRTRWDAALSLANVDWQATRAFPLSMDHASYVRVNLAGREPAGTVHRGEEYDRLCDEIVEAFRALVDAETGRPATDRVIRADEEFGIEVGDVLPDVIVVWSQATIHRLRSPALGEIRVPRDDVRSSAHRPHGFLIGAGPGVRASATATVEGPRIDRVDLAPTVLSRLGVRIPPELPGRPIDPLLG